MSEAEGKKLRPLANAFDGVMISETEFSRLGYDINELDTEDVINVVMDIAQDDGYKLEGRGRDCGGNTFHVGGAEVFSWELDEDDDGPAVLIECEEGLEDEEEEDE